MGYALVRGEPRGWEWGQERGWETLAKRECGAAPGGIWEALAVTAGGRATPEPPPCSPHGAESSGGPGSKLRGRARSRLNEPVSPLWVHCKRPERGWSSPC